MPDLSSSGAPLFERGLAFLDDAGALVGQRNQGGDVWRVSTAPSIAGPWTPVADRGASVIVAGKGRWLAFLSGVGVFGPEGVIGSAMSIGADVQACRGKAAADGTIALVLDYQHGQGVELLALNGEISASASDAQPIGQVAVLDRSRALWSDQRGGVRTIGLPIPQTLPGPVLWPTVLEIGAQLWMLYHSTDAQGLVLHPFDSLVGYRLTLPPAFYPLGVVVSGSRIAVTWATDPADSAGQVRTIDTATEPRTALTSASGPVTQPPVQPPPVQPPPEKPPVSFPNHLDVVQRERAKFSQATLTEDQCWSVTNAVAADPAVAADGWGLTKAPAGGSGYVVNGQNYRLDKLCHPSGYINDILSDTPGAAGAQWGPNADPAGNPSNWAPAIGGPNVPPPTQPPIPPAPTLPPIVSPDDFTVLQQQVAAFEARISALEGKPGLDMSVFAKKGDPVTVKGRIPGLMFSPKDVEWKGTVD